MPFDILLKLMSQFNNLKCKYFNGNEKLKSNIRYVSKIECERSRRKCWQLGSIALNGDGSPRRGNRRTMENTDAMPIPRLSTNRRHHLAFCRFHSDFVSCPLA